MKKLVIGFLLLSSFCFADFLRVEMGAGMLSQDISGEAKYKDARQDLKDDYGFGDKSKNTYIWLNFKHFVPVVPNIRLEHKSFKETSNLKKAFSFGGQVFNVNNEATFDLKQTDIILYYNLLDNTFWTTLDLGLDARLFNGQFKLSNPAISKSASLNFPLPSLYARARVNVPMTGFGAEVDGKFLVYNGSNLNDLTAKVDYAVKLPLLDLGVEVGYRVQNLTINISNVDVESDMKIKGVFGGLFAKF